MTECTVFGYHLWLVPKGEALHRLQAIIDGLADEYDGPSFRPHVTLLSRLTGEEASLVETHRRLANGLEPFELELTAPEAGATYFQCVYMRIAECTSLQRARQAASQAFVSPAGGYMPHLSLFYGDVPENRRATIVDAVPQEARDGFPVGSLHLIRADGREPVDWHLVEKVPLATRRR